MKPITFVLFTFSLISCIKSLENHDALESSIDFPNVNDQKLMRNFIDLPAELKLLVFGHFTPMELFKFSQNTDIKDYHHLIAAAYGSVNRNTAIQLKMDSDDFLLKNNALHFHNSETLIKFLESFDKHITNLKLNFLKFDSTEIRDVFNCIEKCCAKTLTRLEIRHSTYAQLEFVNRITFPNVEELSFFACFFENQTMRLHQSFPNVHHLSATYSHITDRTWVEDNFSNLTHLQLHVNEYAHFTEFEVIKILQNTSETLKSLSLINTSPDLLRKINANFPNIVNLGLIGLQQSFIQNTECIHMEHVERFLFEGFSRYDQFPFVQLDNLMELQWRSQNEFILIDVIENHKNTIESLDIRETGILDEHLAKMPDMPKLERASLQIDSDLSESITTAALFNFMRSNGNLQELRLINVKPNLRNALRTTFNSSGIPCSIEMSDTFWKEMGDVYFIQKSYKATEWENSLKFLRNNFH